LQIALFNNFSIRQPVRLNKILLVRIAAISFLSIWVVGFLLPLLYSLSNPLLDIFITRIYSTVCHQEGAKCISAGDNSMLVCARCAGIYSGALIASFFVLSNIRNIFNYRILLFSIIPLLMDVFLTTSGVYEYKHLLSFSTGIIAGNVLFVLIIAEVESFILKK